MPTGRVIYTPLGGPPQNPGPDKEIYGLMGEENIFRMMSDFYRELESSEIRHLFPADMEEASKKIRGVFCAPAGRPAALFRKVRTARMRARHLPFEIDEAARQVWLGCFERTLQNAGVKYDFPARHLQGFKDFLRSFSAWMVNKA